MDAVLDLNDMDPEDKSELFDCLIEMREEDAEEEEGLKGRQVVKWGCWDLKRAGRVGRQLTKIELGPAETWLKSMKIN